MNKRTRFSLTAPGSHGINHGIAAVTEDLGLYNLVQSIDHVYDELALFIDGGDEFAIVFGGGILQSFQSGTWLASRVAIAVVTPFMPTVSCVTPSLSGLS